MNFLRDLEVLIDNGVFYDFHLIYSYGTHKRPVYLCETSQVIPIIKMLLTEFEIGVSCTVNDSNRYTLQFYLINYYGDKDMFLYCTSCIDFEVEV